MATGLIELNPYNQIKDVMSFVREMGESIAKSGLFGCENVEQGKVLALTCYAKGVDPMSLSDTFHIIGGKLSKRADAMLRDLHRSGGRHRIVERTDKRAEIEITYDGETNRFAFTVEQAMEEPFSKKKNGEVNPNYATPRKRMQMLWARVVSDGVRSTCSEAACGTYTPEEVSDFTNGQTVDEPMAAPSKVEEAEVVDVEAVAVEPVTTTTTTEPKHDVNGYASAEQSIKIRALFDQLQIPADKREAALAKRGAATIRNLKYEAAEEFIRTLESKLASVAVNAMAGESLADPDAVTATNNDPCSEVQVAKAKSIIKELAQVIGPDIATRVKSKLVSHGLKQISDLTVSECDRLIGALAIKNLEAWAENALAGWKQLEGVPF